MNFSDELLDGSYILGSSEKDWEDNKLCFWEFNPLALRALPLSHLRWAEGECRYLDPFPLLWIFRSCFKFIPRQIETYVAASWSPRCETGAQYGRKTYLPAM